MLQAPSDARSLPFTRSGRIVAIACLALAAACSGTRPTNVSGLTPTATLEKGQSPIDALDQRVTQLRDLGATDEDLQDLEQRLRYARSYDQKGDRDYARLLAREGLALAEEVEDTLDETIERDLARTDRTINRTISEIQRDITNDNGPGAMRGLDTVRDLIAKRNSRAESTQGRFETKSWDDEARPLERSVANLREAEEDRQVQPTKYRARFRPSLAKLRGTEPIVLQEAVRAHVQDKWRAARRAYTEALDADPKSYKALFNLGILHLETGRYEKAAPKLEEAFEIGLGLDTLEGAVDFVPDPEPLIAAYEETGQSDKVAAVERRHDARAQAVAAAAAKRDERRAAEPREAPEPARARGRRGRLHGGPGGLQEEAGGGQGGHGRRDHDAGRRPPAHLRARQRPPQGRHHLLVLPDRHRRLRRGDRRPDEPGADRAGVTARLVARLTGGARPRSPTALRHPDPARTRTADRRRA